MASRPVSRLATMGLATCSKKFWLTKNCTSTGLKDKPFPSAKWDTRITWRNSCTGMSSNSHFQDCLVAGRARSVCGSAPGPVESVEEASRLETEVFVKEGSFSYI